MSDLEWYLIGFFTLPALLGAVLVIDALAQRRGWWT